MITKISTQTKITVPIIRKSLQAKSLFPNINGGSIPKIITTMIIPGGMTKKEAFVYQLTRKIPKSVKERWYEVGTNDKIPQVGDQEIKFGDHLSGDPDFEPHDVDLSDYASFSSGDDVPDVGDVLDGLL